VSTVVQASPSSHKPTDGTCVQPVSELHASVVHSLASSQSGGGPPAHAPPEQLSAVVQASPSSQDAEFGVWTQPDDALHESSVHTSASAQSMVEFTQVESWHVSVVQAFSSEQSASITHSRIGIVVVVVVVVVVAPATVVEVVVEGGGHGHCRVTAMPSASCKQ
jgi:hypothetical protein